MTVDYDEYHNLGRTERFGDVFERLRLHTVEAVLRKCQLAAEGLLLDAGAGEGRYLSIWRRHFPQARLIALEVSKVASQRSAARYEFAEHIVSSTESMPLSDACIDAIGTVEVLEHVPSGIAMLKECRRVLKPNGWILLSTPCGNRGSFEWLCARASGNLRRGSEHGVHFGRFDDPTHLRRYRSSELIELCGSLGFVVDAAFFNGHVFLQVAERLEAKVKGTVNLGRRSPKLLKGFERFCDGLGLLDWWLFRRLPFGSTMILVMHARV